MKLSIIYVNYNTTDLLRDSLTSLQSLPIEHEVIVVDNASKRFDPRDITVQFPDVKVITSSENLGFGRGNNLGVEASSGEYLWILNTDTLLPEDQQLERLIKFMDDNPNYGAALPLLTDEKGVIQPAQVSYFPTPTRTLLNIPVRLAAKVLPVARSLYGRVNMDYLSPITRDVEVAVGAALIIRRTAYAQVDGFSPEFFFFYEDSDLCRKLSLAGYKVRWFTEAHMIHLWGASITGMGAFVRRKRLYFASQDVYLKKWHSTGARYLVRLMRLPLIAKYNIFNR